MRFFPTSLLLLPAFTLVEGFLRVVPNQNVKMQDRSRSLDMIDPSSVLDSSDKYVAIGSLEQFIMKGGLPLMALAVAITDSVPLLPTQPISIATGALFSFKGGLLAVVLGQSLATAFALGVGRYIVKPDENDSRFDNDSLIPNGEEINNDSQEDYSKLKKVLQELTTPLNSGNPWTVFCAVVMARQSPVLPFSVGNYFVGAGTNAPLLPAWLGTIIGCLPLNIAWVLAGSSGMAAFDNISNSEVTSEASNLQEGLKIFGVAMTLSFAVYVAKTVYSVYFTTETKEGEILLLDNNTYGATPSTSSSDAQTREAN